MVQDLLHLASSHQIADYDYTGPFRIRKKTLGASSGNRKNASYLLPGYDGLRRVTEFDWKDLNNEKLVGSDYAYDDVGNPLNEKFDHDEDRYDNFKYDALYQLTNVRYRDSGSEDYRTSAVTWTAGNWDRYLYDDNYNRTGSDGTEDA